MSKTTIKAKNMRTYTLPSWAMQYNTDKNKGVPIESQFKGVRFFGFEKELLIVDDSNGGHLGIQYSNIEDFVDELLGIAEAFGGLK